MLPTKVVMLIQFELCVVKYSNASVDIRLQNQPIQVFTYKYFSSKFVTWGLNYNMGSDIVANVGIFKKMKNM